MMVSCLQEIERWGRVYFEKYIYPYDDKLTRNLINYAYNQLIHSSSKEKYDTLSKLSRLLNNNLLDKDLVFILSKSLYKGRRDITSTIAFSRTLYSTNEYLMNNGKEPNKLKLEDLKELRRLLEKYYNIYKLPNSNDIRHITELYRKLFIEDKISIRDIFQEINNNKSLYKPYRLFDLIYGIGPKIASFIVRDIIFMGIKSGIINENEVNQFDSIWTTFPIDTHVFKLTKRLKLHNEEKIPSSDEEKEELMMEITHRLKDLKVSVPFFNAGAWYIYFKNINICI
ncbi:hypothetical protein [Saccharolobus islandicus]|uniref:DNA-(apurinic or apyrimidinic site) lyase n=1 Tax=Saccharolobus islandicus (strain M.14.25 / Kamchatka \|nr:hypothetical protein [Sulfolobus islandicus]ACP37686.1 hypothetical protein M1425_0891 [Sulfolobus islandicus M.14.25]